MRRFLTHSSWARFRRPARKLLRSRYGSLRPRKRFGFRRRRIRRFGRKQRRGYRRRKGRRFGKRSSAWRDNPKFTPLTRFQVLKASYGQQNGIPLDASGKPQCEYFTAELYGSNTKDTVATLPLNCNYHMAKIADIMWKGPVGTSTGSMAQVTSNDQELTGSTTNIDTVIQVKSSVNYTLRCATNESIDLTMYVVKARHNISSSTFYNVYQQLTRGFAQNGLDPTHNQAQGANLNLAFVDPQWTPYQSSQFCRDWKIVRQKKLTIAGGKERRFALKGKRFYFKPVDYFVAMGTPTPSTWAGAAYQFQNNKFERFILFQARSRVIASGATLIANYSQSVANSADRMEMESFFTYQVRIMKQAKTPYGYLDPASGFTGVGANPQFINEKTYAQASIQTVT